MVEYRILSQSERDAINRDLYDTYMKKKGLLENTRQTLRNIESGMITFPDSMRDEIIRKLQELEQDIMSGNYPIPK